MFEHSSGGILILCYIKSMSFGLCHKHDVLYFLVRILAMSVGFSLKSKPCQVHIVLKIFETIQHCHSILLCTHTHSHTHTHTHTRTHAHTHNVTCSHTHTHISFRLCPSTAGCCPPSMLSIVVCLMLSCSR